MDLATFLGGILLCIVFGAVLLFMAAFVIVFLFFAAQAVVRFVVSKRPKKEPPTP